MSKPNFKDYNIIYGRTLGYNDIPESAKKKDIAMIHLMPKSIEEADYYQDYMLVHNPDQGTGGFEINRWTPLFYQCMLGDIVEYEEWLEPRNYSRGGELDEKNDCYIVRTLSRNLSHEKRIKEFDKRYKQWKQMHAKVNAKEKVK